jgi:hypothetical protein
MILLITLLTATVVLAGLALLPGFTPRIRSSNEHALATLEKVTC